MNNFACQRPPSSPKNESRFQRKQPPTTFRRPNIYEQICILIPKEQNLSKKFQLVLEAAKAANKLKNHKGFNDSLTKAQNIIRYYKEQGNLEMQYQKQRLLLIFYIEIYGSNAITLLSNIKNFLLKIELLTKLAIHEMLKSDLFKNNYKKLIDDLSAPLNNPKDISIIFEIIKKDSKYQKGNAFFETAENMLKYIENIKDKDRANQILATYYFGIDKIKCSKHIDLISDLALKANTCINITNEYLKFGYPKIAREFLSKAYEAISYIKNNHIKQFLLTTTYDIAAKNNIKLH
jgi:hypothetical protein